MGTATEPPPSSHRRVTQLSSPRLPGFGAGGTGRHQLAPPRGRRRRHRTAQGETEPRRPLQGAGGPGTRGELHGRGVPRARGRREHRGRSTPREDQEDRVLPVRLEAGQVGARPPRHGQRRPVPPHVHQARCHGRAAGLRHWDAHPVRLHRVRARAPGGGEGSTTGPAPTPSYPSPPTRSTAACRGSTPSPRRAGRPN